MKSHTIAVLRGGPSSEYDISLITGAAVLKELAKKPAYKLVDILIDKEGNWHRDGTAKLPAKALEMVDVAVLALHGEFGEDGKVQQILESVHVPYTGSGVVASALGMNKILAKAAFKKAGLRVPLDTIVDAKKDLERQGHEIFKNFPMPVIVKPAGAGSSVGITIARDLASLIAGLHTAAKFGDEILVEQFIKGREATCGVIEQFRNEEIYSLLPVEIIPPPKAQFFDREVKYSGDTQEICPGNFTREITEQLQNMAKMAHQVLGMRHYSRSDFIVTPKNVYILEINSLPGLTPQSLLPKSLAAVGSSLGEFLDHIIQLALKNK